jgi:hypothetical protein
VLGVDSEGEVDRDEGTDGARLGKRPSNRTARGSVPLLRRCAEGSELGGDNMAADVAGRVALAEGADIKMLPQLGCITWANSWGKLRLR